MLTGIVIITLLVSALVPIMVHYLKGPRLGWGLALIPLFLFIYFIHLIPNYHARRDYLFRVPLGSRLKY